MLASYVVPNFTKRFSLVAIPNFYVNIYVLYVVVPATDERHQ